VGRIEKAEEIVGEDRLLALCTGVSAVSMKSE
jgi:hypothetical protein